ncbi:MAG: flavodoxin-dependent (E)-4-hydroxy-3-methylbut-2-enyl-diphosphate synthase, partial [Muribaculaceae bacterium]|nr:flavodoxin-dependent (E)-4-hydroxy-3-methylbut-2-enyl-diphosphate synthase [Muribaculaceae bacterium]
PLLESCKAHSTSVRLGVNHGSLSDRIMSRYGDTPAGMVESVMEFLRICREVDFHNIVISIKASNTVVMTETVRLLDKAMTEEGMNYPLHLGVTEAGDGEDGRIKSAIGIGTLLCEGLGDTIRVSLSEPPENEIPVAVHLRDYIVKRENHTHIENPASLAPYPQRDSAVPFPGKQKAGYPLVEGVDFTLNDFDFITADASQPVISPEREQPVILSSTHINAPGEIASWIERYHAGGGRMPVIIKLRYDGTDKEKIQVESAADFGVLLLHGYGSGIILDAPGLSREERENIALGILQGTRLRFSRTEYIACPGCGRTLFDLQSTLQEVKKATAGMKGLKIGVMGCIVNGPGEMADADYGYVGAGPGRVSLYKGKELMLKNIPTEEALPALLALIEGKQFPSREL